MEKGDADLCRFLNLTFFEIETFIKHKKQKTKDRYMLIENATAILTERIAFLLGSKMKPRHVFEIFEDLFEEEKMAHDQFIAEQRAALRRARRLDEEIQRKINKESEVK